MNLIIEKDGQVRGVYGEEIALDALGPLAITRASHVEQTSRDAGRPTCRPSAGRSSALLTDDPKRWRQRWLGWSGIG